MTKQKKKYILLLILSVFLTFSSFSISNISQTILGINTDNKTPDFLKENNWADSVFNAMTLDQKIGQLFMVAAYSNKDASHEQSLKQLISKYNIGGLIFFKGTPTKQVQMTNKFQSLAKTPLLIGIDGEWGVSMRLDSTTKYPRQMMLGAIQSDSLIYQMGTQIAQQCKDLGIHVNFAPVIDINNNPKNPVINNRSFGEVKEHVTKLGLAYMNGMQDKGIIACGKHFPGHGDTDMDSHKSLPTIPHTFDRLDSLELYPFKQLINNGLASMMVAHLFIPELDKTPNQASTLSPKIVNGLLKDSLGFKGLIFTDALNMKGVAKYYQPGDVDVQAIIAGNDILLFPEDVPIAIAKIKEAIINKKITISDIEKSCLKILKAKAWVGLDKFKPLSTSNLFERLNPIENEILNKNMANQSLTLIKNDNNILPFKELDTLNMVYLNIGGTSNNEFHQSINKYYKIKEIKIPRSLSITEEANLLEKLEAYDQIIIGFHRTNNNPRRNFGITHQAIHLQNKLAETKAVYTVIFGNPYVLESFHDQTNTKAIIITYQDTKHTKKAAGELLFGGIKPLGKLPVSCTDSFPALTGLSYKSTTRLRFVSPEQIGVNQKQIDKIDYLAKKGIRLKAYPGCQLLAIKDGAVFYNKSFGHHTYSKKRKVSNTDLYDIASITKIAATTYSLMRLTDLKKLDIDKTLGDYIPEIVNGTPYKQTVIRQMLAHQAGFVSWIPFYYKTLKNGKPDPFYYNSTKTDKYSVQLTDNLFITPSYKDSIFNRITSTNLRRKKYKYSDIGYYFLNELISKVSGKSLNKYVEDEFYKPLGLSNITYLPLEKIDKSRITPTELDTVFRKELIHGHVHDPGAAMIGGVGGHAGVFSNALDLGVLMYTLINDGKYGGQQILSKETISDFTKCQYCPTNRRGAGFDKPVRSLDGGPTCNQVSLSSFGHSGFTGTITWADPEHGIVYVFLSNRVYPNANNWKITKENIRTDIQSAIYDACK